MNKSVLPANAPVLVGDRWVFPDGKTLPMIRGGDGPTDTATTTPNQEVVERLQKAKAIVDGVHALGREFNDEERAEVKRLLDEAAEIKTKSEDSKAKAKSDQALLAQMAALSTPVDGNEAKAVNELTLSGATVGQQQAVVRKSLGERYAESDPFKAFKTLYPHGPGENARIQIDPFEAGSMKALLSQADFPGMTPTDMQGLMFPPIWGRDLVIRDVITTGTTTSDSVEFARQLSMTSAAAPVPETLTDAADATPTTAEGFKPQSEFTFEKVTVTVKVIAHWLAATRKALSDVGQLRTLIDSFLRFGLEEELEDQIVSGSGAGENFAGIMNVSGTQAQAFSVNPIETIRKALTKVRTIGRARPNAVGLNPADDEALDLAKDLQNRYYGLGPFGTGPATIWGYPRVVSEAVPVGFAIVADWRFAALWDREAATISVTDSHNDFFIRNLIAVLAELRAAFGVIRPAAFVIADLTV